MQNNKLSLISDNIYKTYLKFTFPNMIGLIAMSSVALVDGYFVSNYVNSVALAAINIIIPLITVVFGISIMITIGATVLIGNYLGKSEIEKASSIFTKALITITVISLLFSIVCFIFSYEISKLLGANEEIIIYAVPYLKMVSCFFLFQSLEYSLSVIIRTDGNPYLASISVFMGATINVVLDYIFIIKMDMGISGAALGTGISFISSTFLILFHFFLKKGRLYLTKNMRNWKEIALASYNGFSELLIEASVATVAYIFNNIMVMSMGTEGVEAFTIINSALWLTNMLCYGVGDSLVPLISTNYGAKKYNRIAKIISLSRISVLIIGLIMFLLSAFMPEKIINIFLDKNADEKAFFIALIFLDYVKYAFLFIGLNIVFSATCTAFQKPLQSIIIALSRGLILPVAFIYIMPKIFVEIGIYIAVPLAEIFTLIICIVLWINVRTNIFPKNYKFNNINKL